MGLNITWADKDKTAAVGSGPRTWRGVDANEVKNVVNNFRASLVDGLVPLSELPDAVKRILNALDFDATGIENGFIVFWDQGTGKFRTKAEANVGTNLNIGGNTDVFLFDREIDGNEVTLLIGLEAQLAGRVLAAPATETGTPTFRRLVVSDILGLEGFITAQAVASVQTIADLNTFVRGDIRTVIVRDDLRGGKFAYVEQEDFIGVPDNGISFTAQDGGYWVRIFKGPIQDSWYGTNANYIPGTEASGDNDGVILTNIINAIPDGSTLQLKSNANYRLDTAITITNKTITLDLNGSTLWQTSNTQILRHTGGYEWSEPVESLSIQELVLGAEGDVPYNYLRIEVTGLPEIEVGDIIKLTSEDQIPGSQAPSGSTIARMGEMAVVQAVDTDYIYITIPVDYELYVTSPRVHKLNKSRIIIQNGKLSTIETDNNWSTAMIFAFDSAFSEFNDIKSEKSWGPVLELRGLFMPKSNNCYFSNADTKQGLRVGYGIRDFACHYGLFSHIRATRVRHAYTTNQSFISDDNTADIWRYGRNLGSLITDSLAYACDDGAFDTHAGAYNTVFDNCHVYNNYPGNASLGLAWKIRGYNVTVRNCSGRARTGLQVLEQYPNGTDNILFQNCYFEGVFSSIRTSVSNGGIRCTNIRFTDCEFVSTGTVNQLLLDIDVEYDNCKFTAKNPSGSVRYFDANRSTVKSKNCRFNYPSGAALMRLVFLSGGSVNVKIVDPEITTSKTNIDMLVFRNSTTGNVVSLENMKINKPILDLFDDGTDLTLKYNWERTDTFDTSGRFGQNFNENLVIDVSRLLDKEITIFRTDNVANFNISSISNAGREGQRLTIVNTVGAFRLGVNAASNIALAGGLNKQLRPNTRITLDWFNNQWNEYTDIRQYRKQVFSTDAAATILAWAEIVVFEDVLDSDDRAFNLRDPAEVIDTFVTIINRSTNATNTWNSVRTIKNPDETDLVSLENQTTYTLFSDGTVWRVITKLQ
jgi:hypothetical protein